MTFIAIVPTPLQRDMKKIAQGLKILPTNRGL